MRDIFTFKPPQELQRTLRRLEQLLLLADFCEAYLHALQQNASLGMLSPTLAS